MNFRITFLTVSLILFSALNTILSAQDRDQLEQLTRDYMTYELIDQDLEKAQALFNPEASFQWPGGGGENLTAENFIQWRRQQSVNVKNEVTIDAIRVDGNESIVFAFWKGTVLQNEEHPERVGRVASVPFVYRFTWEDEQITRLEMYWDGSKIERDMENE